MVQNDILASYLNPAADLVVSPTTLDFGDRFVTTTLDRVLSVTGLSIAPDTGSITVSAPPGFAVAAAPTGPFGPSLSLNYTGGSLPPTNVSVRFQPAAVQAYSGNLTVQTEGGNTQTVALQGNGLTAPTGAEETLTYALTGSGDCSSATGFASCSPEVLSGLYVNSYQAVDTFPVSQRLSILNAVTPDEWPAEIDINPLRYAQFAVTPTAGRSLVVDAVSLYAGASGGSGMAFRVEYSTSSTFAASTVLGDYPSNVSNVVNQLSFNPVLTLAPGQSLFVRVYPYYKSVASGKYLVLQNLMVHGFAQ